MLNASVRRPDSIVLGRIACSRERNGPTSPAPTVMFPTMPARTAGHQSVERKRSVPATKSIKAKKTRTRLRPIRSARKLETPVYRALVRTVTVTTTPMANASRPSSFKYTPNATLRNP